MPNLPYKTLPEYNYIGKPGLRPKQAYKKVIGEALFSRDYSAPGMLYAKCLSSTPYVHARIKNMDTSKAAALPGVVDIIRFDDPNDKMAEEGATGVMVMGGDRGYRFIEDSLYYSDQPFGAIVCAESEEICDEALKLIEIEWEELPFSVIPAESLEKNSPLLYPELNSDNNLSGVEEYTLGDIEKGFLEADHIIEFTSEHAQQTVAGVEGNSAMVKCEGDDIHIWSQQQFPNQCEMFMILDPVSKNIGSNHVHIYTPFSGGHFGGWGFIAYCGRYPQLAVMLAKRTGRPVMSLDDRSHFIVKANPFGTMNVKVGFKNDGTITAVDIEGIQISTYYFTHLQHHWGVPNMRVISQIAYLNLPCSTTIRDDACECYPHQLINTHVAAELGMDPVEVARINDGSDGQNREKFAEEKRKIGLPDFDSLEECLKIGKQAINWDSKWHPPGTKKLPNGKMHGMGFVYAAEWGARFKYYGKIAIRVNPDGKVLLNYRRLDPGMMTENAYARIVADEMGMKYEDIHTATTNDDGNFDVWGPGGSSGTGTNAPAFIDGAKKAKQKILELATTAPTFLQATFNGKTPEELDIKESVVFEKANPANKYTVREVLQRWGGISAYHNFVFHMEDDVICIGETPGFGWADYSSHLGRQTQFAEVEVDPETGEVDIIKVVTVNDMGKIINPDGCNGQQYGGAYMGLGWGYSEQVIQDPSTGINLNDDLINYKWFTMNDIGGHIDCHLIEGGLGLGPYGSSGIGECVGASSHGLLMNAIQNAIGKYVDDFPATPQKILKALGKA